MAIDEQAQRDLDTLLPGQDSALNVIDLELIGVFDNFASDEVLRHRGLHTRQRLMVQLAVDREPVPLPVPRDARCDA